MPLVEAEDDPAAPEAAALDAGPDEAPAEEAVLLAAAALEPGAAADVVDPLELEPHAVSSRAVTAQQADGRNRPGGVIASQGEHGR